MKKNIVVIVLAMVLTGLGLHGQSIEIQSPVGNESLSVGKILPITWTSSGVTGPLSIKLRLADQPDAFPVLEILASAPISGTYKWTIPASLASGRYLIRVRTVAETGFAYSDSNAFTVTGRVLTQNQPATLPPDHGLPQMNINQSPAFANKPDFEIVDIERLAGGVFWAKLHNRGKAAYKGPLSFHVDFGTAADGLVTVPVNVAAGATQSVSLEYYLRNEDLGARGCVLVKVVANSDKKVAEINENNNEKSRLFSNVKKIEIKVTPQESTGPYPLPVSVTVTLDVFAAGEVSVKISGTNGGTGVLKCVLPASGSHEFKEDESPIREDWLGMYSSNNRCYSKGGYCVTIWAWVDGCEPDGRKIEANPVTCSYYKPQ